MSPSERITEGARSNTPQYPTIAAAEKAARSQTAWMTVASAGLPWWGKPPGSPW